MDKSVEVLHDEYIISGETYLFCVDNDLQTLEDVAGCFADGTAVCSARVRSEIESILNLYATQASITDETVKPDVINYSEGRQKAYLQLKGQCTMRTKNALNYLESWLGFPDDAFWAFLMDKGNRMYNFKRIRNVGNKTVDELLVMVERLEEMSFEDVAPKQTENSPASLTASVSDESNDDKQLDLFEFAVEREMNILSVRSKNALLRLLNQNGNSILELYKTFHKPNFDLLTVKNVGKGTVLELRGFIKRVDMLWEIYQSPEGTTRQAHSIRIGALQKDFGITEEEAQSIVNEFPDIDVPPLFKMIDTVMRRSHREWTIISNTLNILHGQTLNNSQDTAEKLGLSRERVRQLRNKLYTSICTMIRSWGSNKGEYDFSHYLDYCRMEYNDQHIDRLNKEEKVYFNSNFVYRVLSLFFHEQYILVGNDFKAFTETGNDESNIFIVPKELSGIFNFTAMLDDMRLKFNSKVYEDYSIELNQYLLQFFYDDIFFDKIPELLELCYKIIHRIFGIVAINDTLVIEKNATKPIPEILEEILSENGEAMSLDEIYEHFKARVPDYSRDKNSFRGNLGNSNNIVPVSRTGFYVLKEWEKRGIKGGTIRDIIFEFLLESDHPLPIEEIVGYVLLFREGTNEKSVYSNMFADNAKRFAAYEYDGNRRYGLTQKIYDDNYALIEEERIGSKRGFKDSIELLERFIKEHDRFPFSSSDDSDEMRLNRFWGLHKARREKGSLGTEQLSEMKRIEELYGDKEYSKKDFLAMHQAKIASMRSTLFSMGIDPDM